MQQLIKKDVEGGRKRGGFRGGKEERKVYMWRFLHTLSFAGTYYFVFLSILRHLASYDCISGSCCVYKEARKRSLWGVKWREGGVGHSRGVLFEYEAVESYTNN